MAQTEPAVGAPLERLVRPCAWRREDGMKVITDDELDAWIQAGDGQIVDDYTVPLYDEAALKAGIAAERARCAMIAHNGCLVYPDGGSPTEEEAALCEEIARRIRGA